MPSPPRRSCAALGVASVAAVTTAVSLAAQPDPPPKVLPAYTAFPELKVPVKEVEDGGRKLTVRDHDQMFRRMRAVHARPIPADAPPLVKVRALQLDAGVSALERILRRIDIGAWRTEEYYALKYRLAEVLAVAAELEPEPAGKVALYADRVVAMKDLEGVTEARTETGEARPYELNSARVARLEAEADLLRLRGQFAGRDLTPPKLDRQPAPEGGLSVSPPGLPPGSTVFPDLKVPMQEVEVDGKKVSVPDRDRLSRRLLAGHPRPVPDGGPPLTRVLTAQVNEGVMYIALVRRRIDLGAWRTEEYIYQTEMISDVYRATEELEAEAAGKIAVAEDRVVAMKDLELIILARVETGEVRPYEGNLIQFHRLEAEADLLRLKDRLAGAGPVPRPKGPAPAGGPPPAPRLGDPGGFDPPPLPPVTAFPGLTVPLKEVEAGGKKVLAPDHDRVLRRLLAGHPRPIPAGAPPLVKVRTAQVNEGMAYLDLARRRIELGAWRTEEYAELTRMIPRTFRAAGELQAGAAGRVAVAEDRVVAMKDLERATELRVQTGEAHPYDLSHARFHRLEAEADLLRLRGQPAAPRK